MFPEPNLQPQLPTGIKRATNHGCPCIHKGRITVKSRDTAAVCFTVYLVSEPDFSHQSLQDLFVSEGQLVVLECRVKGTPSPRVDWYREGKTIEDSPDFRILQKSKFCLMI